MTEDVYTDRDINIHAAATRQMVVHELAELGVSEEDSLGLFAAVGKIAGSVSREDAPAYGLPAAELDKSSRTPLTDAGSVAEGEGMETTIEATGIGRAIRERSHPARICNPSPYHLAMPPLEERDEDTDADAERKPATETSTDELLAQARRLSAEGLHEAADALYEAAVRRGGGA